MRVVTGLFYGGTMDKILIDHPRFDQIKNIIAFLIRQILQISWRYPRFRWGPFTQDALYIYLSEPISHGDYIIQSITTFDRLRQRGLILIYANFAWIKWYTKLSKCNRKRIYQLPNYNILIGDKPKPISMTAFPDNLFSHPFDDSFLVDWHG